MPWPPAFYHGEIAKTIVRDLQNTSGIITEADMASYIAVERAALRTEYRGRVVYTGEAPSRYAQVCEGKHEPQKFLTRRAQMLSG